MRAALSSIALALAVTGCAPEYEYVPVTVPVANGAAVTPATPAPVAGYYGGAPDYYAYGYNPYYYGYPYYYGGAYRPWYGGRYYWGGWRGAHPYGYGGRYYGGFHGGGFRGGFHGGGFHGGHR